MLKRIFQFFSPILIFKISGKSMEPTLYQGQKVLVWKYGLCRVGNIVVLKNPITDLFITKRIKEIKKGKYFVVGDNKNESSDSRDFGWIKRENIIGKILFIFR
ncbi:MAG TPA: S26 family signal peptidase [Patescibacteria group bacterium]